MKKITLLAGMIAFISLLASAQSTLDKSFNGIKKIKLSTASGDCKVSKSSGSNVTVNLKHTYEESRYTPTIEQQGDQLTIKEIFKSGNNNGEATWTLTIPDGVDIDINSGSGNIDISNLNLNLKVSTGSGDLDFKNLKGKLKGNTGSGEIVVKTFSGTLNANTGSGNVEINDSNGDLALNCGSGDLRIINSQAEFSLNTGSGNIKGESITLSGKSSFNTGSGDAELILAATPKFDVSINSGSGDAIIDFNGNEIKGDITMRASKHHGKIIAPFEFDKTEEINNGGSDNTTIEKTVVKGNGMNRISINTGSGDAVIKK